MKTYKYTGLFQSDDGDTYEISVNCNGTIQALFLLTADAIRGAKHYQLKTITDEEGRTTYVGSILEVSEILKN